MRVEHDNIKQTIIGFNRHPRRPYFKSRNRERIKYQNRFCHNVPSRAIDRELIRATPVREKSTKYRVRISKESPLAFEMTRGIFHNKNIVPLPHRIEGIKFSIDPHYID